MIYFTPGPSQLYPTVKKHMLQALAEDIPSLSHRSDRYHLLFKDTLDSFKKLMDIPEDYEIFFTASATEAMERIIENCAAKNSFHIVNGVFSDRFYNIACDLKKNATKITVEPKYKSILQDIHIPKNTELICITQNETNNGLQIPTEEIEHIKNKHPECLIAIDIVSSAPYVKLNFEKTDCVFLSVQKGFGLPAGLALLIVSPQAIEKAKYLTKKGYNVGSYHKFVEMQKQAKMYQTLETPNVLGMYLLNKVIDDLTEYGLEQTRKDTKTKADLLYNFFDNSGTYKPFIEFNNVRSQTVIVVTSKIPPNKIINDLTTKGLLIGSGYNELKDTTFRIANFPAHQIDDVKNLINKIDNIT